jgi:methyl-accepting chemotaxis protein
MNWNHLTIGKKIALGFGVTLALLGVVGCLSYFGVGGIVRNAGEVIDGNKLAGMQEARDVYAQKTLPALERVRTLLGNIRQEARKHIMTDEIMLQSARGTRRNVLLVGGLAVLVGIGLAFLISRSIIIALKEISSQMEEGADQVSSAAGQVSSASQSLAEGASEQAASIEETSSSLEEMSSMTRQNADNATQADPLMKEANQVVHSANTSMDELTQSMEEISKAS